MKDLLPLPASGCRALLARTPVGRLIFTEGAMPTARPVNFFLHHNDIVVRTSRDSALAGLGDQVVALEIDGLDSGDETGWSVVAVGKAKVVGDLESLAACTDPHRRPWVPRGPQRGAPDPDRDRHGLVPVGARMCHCLALFGLPTRAFA